MTSMSNCFCRGEGRGPCQTLSRKIGGCGGEQRAWLAFVELRWPAQPRPNEAFRRGITGREGPSACFPWADPIDRVDWTLFVNSHGFKGFFCSSGTWTLLSLTF